eukprot:6193544-Pleurochrysis_carterae.AAC.2
MESVNHQSGSCAFSLPEPLKASRKSLFAAVYTSHLSRRELTAFPSERDRDGFLFFAACSVAPRSVALRRSPTQHWRALRQAVFVIIRCQASPGVAGRSKAVSCKSRAAPCCFMLVRALHR